MTNPIHPLRGQTLAIRKIRQLGTHLMVSMDHPDGGSISLPASETNLAPLSVQPGASLQPSRFFEPRNLLRLIEKLRSRNSPLKTDSGH
ncbi:hypothetical protein HC928_08310 [bacterium]|nr:hypothetical protein [bacterium]